jgi:predicted CoA-binding protein
MSKTHHSPHRVAILGASPDPDRYAFKAMKMLEEHGQRVFLVNQKYPEIAGHKTFASLKELVSKERIDVLTLYVGAAISQKMADDIVAIAPQLVIFNPGTENPELTTQLDQHNIRWIHACTLVLLSTDQFDSAVDSAG